jgi:hypothetical protein
MSFKYQHYNQYHSHHNHQMHSPLLQSAQSQIYSIGLEHKKSAGK